MVVRGWGWGKWGEVVKSKLAAIRGTRLGHPMYGIVITINNTGHCIPKFLREWILKVITAHNENRNYLRGWRC